MMRHTVALVGSMWLIGAIGTVLMVLGGLSHIYAERDRVVRLRGRVGLQHTTRAVLDDAAMATIMLGACWTGIAAIALADPAYISQPLLHGSGYSIAYVTAALFSALGGSLGLFWWLRVLAHFGVHRWTALSYEECANGSSH